MKIYWKEDASGEIVSLIPQKIKEEKIIIKKKKKKEARTLRVEDRAFGKNMYEHALSTERPLPRMKNRS